MEFNQKLQELRKQKGITQEELATNLYVSRTAISKWESGRGYPNIESLKAIAKFFSVTVDSLISTNEILLIAEEDNKQKQKNLRDLIYGLLDISILMLFFLPIFAEKVGEVFLSVSLASLTNIQQYLKIVYYVIVIASAMIGILTLALQNCQLNVWLKIKTKLSIVLGTILVLIFMISSQVYAGVFAFTLLIIKTFMFIKQ